MDIEVKTLPRSGAVQIDRSIRCMHFTALQTASDAPRLRFGRDATTSSRCLPKASNRHSAMKTSPFSEVGCPYLNAG